MLVVHEVRGVRSTLKLINSIPGALESHKTVGQAVRGLVQFRKLSEGVPETETASDRGSQTGIQPKVEATGSESTVFDSGGNSEGDEATAQSSFSRHWFNTVLYGTPTMLLNPLKAN